MKTENEELLKEFSAEQVEKLDGSSTATAENRRLDSRLGRGPVALEYLPVSVQKRIAKGLNLPFSRVYGVVTFYSFFTMTPKGRTHGARMSRTAVTSGAARPLRKPWKRPSASMKGNHRRPSLHLRIGSLPRACGLGPVVSLTTMFTARQAVKLKTSLPIPIREGQDMAKLTIADLKKIKEKVIADTPFVKDTSA
jgi:NADH-quinone oxidoreductase subunit E/NADP-reducing hydrogenase subunit HndA